MTHANPPGDAQPARHDRPAAARHRGPARRSRHRARRCRDGEVGELVVRGPQVMKGYYNNPQATAAVLRDGWLYTGDMARRDARRLLHHRGSQKGHHQDVGLPGVPGGGGGGDRGRSPAWPRRRWSACRTRSAARWSRRWWCRAATASSTWRRWRAHCRQHLGKHKRPRQIEVVARAAEELPRQGAAPQAARGRTGRCSARRRRRPTWLVTPGGSHHARHRHSRRRPHALRQGLRPAGRRAGPGTRPRRRRRTRCAAPACGPTRSIRSSSATSPAGRRRQHRPRHRPARPASRRTASPTPSSATAPPAWRRSPRPPSSSSSARRRRSSPAAPSR